MNVNRFVFSISLSILVAAFPLICEAESIGTNFKTSYFKKIVNTGTFESLLDKEDILLLLREVKYERDYLLATKTLDRKESWLSRSGTKLLVDKLEKILDELKKDPYGLLVSVGLLQILHGMNTAAILMEIGDAAKKTPRLEVILSKWWGHTIALVKIYEVLSDNQFEVSASPSRKE